MPVFPQFFGEGDKYNSLLLCIFPRGDWNEFIYPYWLLHVHRTRMILEQQTRLNKL